MKFESLTAKMGIVETVSTNRYKPLPTSGQPLANLWPTSARPCALLSISAILNEPLPTSASLANLCQPLPASASFC